ncbi:MAG TPA: Hsp70 family protein [Blastocatellia bacterium]|nr:Hsp70 family protein [Blastocatellia bacterium]
MLCPNCRKWEVAAADIYCSWCRAILVDFEVSLDRKYAYVGEVISEPLTLTIKHSGTIGSLHLDRIESDQEWLEINTRQLPNPILQQGATITLPVEVDTMALPDGTHLARVTIDTPIGSRSASFEVVPRPEIQVFTGDYTVLLDNLPEEKLTGYLAVTRGIVSVADLSTDVPWAKVKLLNDATYPFLLDSRSSSRLEFKFIMDEAMLMTMSGGTLPAEYKGNLVIKYIELEPERTEPFHINCFLAPELKIPQESGMRIKRDVYTDRREELYLTLQNGENGEKGRAELQVLGVEIKADWLQPTAQISYPLTIPSGLFNQLSFTITPREIGEGLQNAKVTFITNTPGPNRQKDVYLEIDVKQMPDFEGTLAIDFGTVNSCCATFDKLGQPKLINLESQDSNSQKPTTAPSVILYHDRVDGNTRLYEIGSKAYLYSFQPLAAPSTVRQVKRNLGKSMRFNISYFDDLSKQDSLTPKDVTADILKRILERAEDELKERIVRCTVSHPSRFSLRQIEDLKASLLACGIQPDKVTTMHEPLGAALNYIQESRPPKDDEQYHLMVFDFGGGTTDITLLDVTCRWDEEQQIYVVTPKVLGATGDRWFGGEDVTDIVMDLALEKCKALATKKYQQADAPKREIIIPFKAEDFVNDARRQTTARENRIYLREWAEDAKLAISDYAAKGDDSDPPTISIPAISVIVDKDVIELSGIVANELEMDPFAIAPSVDELNAQLRPRLKNLMEMMRRLAVNNGIVSPDVILLSGKSSALSIVQEVISDQFPGADIHRPNDLKECVVLGACQFSHEEAVAEIYINVEESSCLSATTSRLGVRVNESGQIKFKEIIDAGVPIGSDGLRVPVTGTIFRRNTRIRILENTGLEDEMVINGKENQNITPLKEFRLEQRLAEWESSHDTKISDKELFDAKLELEITPNLGVKLIARVPGVDEPFEFEANFSGW